MQKDDDPFRLPDDNDRTVFIPTPGGGRRRGGAAARDGEAPPPGAAEAPPAPPPDGAAAAPLPEGIGSNPLLRAAASLFALARQLRGLRRHDDVAGLRRDVIQAMRQFDADARRAGVDAKTAAQAAYALCALLDETVLGTPWGIESIWAKQSLLITFYKEYTAGDTFFNFLKKAKELPQQYLDLLEFFYVCLSLGFQGRFRVVEGGSNELSRIKQELYTTIVRERAAPERELSPRWRGVEDKGPRVSRLVPLWVVAVAGLAIALAAFVGFSFALNARSDPVHARLTQLVTTAPRPVPVVVPPPAKAQTAAERLRITLDEEIRLRLVDVQDLGDALRIIIYNRGMFASGRADVAPTFDPLINKIALFIAQFPGPFLVTGHTDNVPSRSVRFPSNWHLSKARADAVADILARFGVDRSRLRVEGRSEGEPIASNETAEGRAQNRRVEIKVPVAGGGSGT